MNAPCKKCGRSFTPLRRSHCNDIAPSVYNSTKQYCRLYIVGLPLMGALMLVRLGVATIVTLTA